MKIGIDIRHLASPRPSGVGYYTMHIIEHMARLAPDVHFLLFASGSKRVRNHLPTFHAPNIKLVTVPIANRLLTSLLLLPGGPSLEDFMQEKPDVWLFPNINIIKTRKPYAITIHDLSFELFKQFYRKKTLLWHKLSRPKKLCERAGAVLAVSSQTNHDIQRLYRIGESSITTTLLGVDDDFHPNIKPEDQAVLRHHGITTPFLLTLCTLEPRKNLSSVIEAYDRWANSCTKKPQLILAGGSGLKHDDLDDVIALTKHKAHIKRIGYIPKEHSTILYRNAHAFLFPSFYEGFGLPVLEAMASGTPVITSFTGSLPEVAGDAAILVDPFNVTDIEQSLAQLCGDLTGQQPTALASFLSKKGLLRAEKFRWKTTAEKTLNALKNIA